MSRDESRHRMGWEGWLLVVVVLFALVVVPAVILLRPPTGVSFRFAYLILPTVPAILLGVVAVWAVLRSA